MHPFPIAYEKFVAEAESCPAVQVLDTLEKKQARIQLFTKAPNEIHGQYFGVSQEAYELLSSEAKLVRKYFARVHQLSISITPCWRGAKYRGKTNRFSVT